MNSERFRILLDRNNLLSDPNFLHWYNLDSNGWIPKLPFQGTSCHHYGCINLYEFHGVRYKLVQMLDSPLTNCPYSFLLMGLLSENLDWA